MMRHSGYQEPASSFEFGGLGTHRTFLLLIRSFSTTRSNADIRNPDSGYQELQFGVSGTEVQGFLFSIRVLRLIFRGVTLNQTHINTTAFKCRHEQA